MKISKYTLSYYNWPLQNYNFKKKVCQRQLFEGLVMETLISTLDEEAIINQLKESVSKEG